MQPLTPPRVLDDRGASAVLVAGALTFLLAIVALTVDLGFARTRGLDIQNAADAGALAGVFEVPDDAAAARDIAADYALRGLQMRAPAGNPCGTDTGCYFAGSYTVRVTTPFDVPDSDFDADQIVQVEVCTSTPTFFGQVMGFESIGLCRQAVAATQAGGPGACALCVLGPRGTTLDVSGTGAISVSNGSVVVNSDHPRAISVSGGGTISSDDEIGVNGGASGPAGAFSPAPTHHDPVDDPLIDLPAPAVSGSPHPKVQLTGSRDATLSPGIYSEIKSTSTGQLDLQPGIYVVTEALTISSSPASGKVSLNAPGVMIYLACSDYPDPCKPRESGASLTLTGGAIVNWSPPASGTYQGVSIFADRNNTATTKFTGSSGTAFAGTVYMKSGELWVTGNSGSSTTMNSAIVVDSIRQDGNSGIEVAFDPDVNAEAVAGDDRRLIG